MNALLKLLGMPDAQASDMQRESNSNFLDNEVDHTNSLIFLVQNMLCSELHRQKEFKLDFLFT